MPVLFTMCQNCTTGSVQLKLRECAGCGNPQLVFSSPQTLARVPEGVRWGVFRPHSELASRARSSCTRSLEKSRASRERAQRARHGLKLRWRRLGWWKYARGGRGDKDEEEEGGAEIDEKTQVDQWWCSPRDTACRRSVTLKILEDGLRPRLMYHSQTPDIQSRPRETSREELEEMVQARTEVKDPRGPPLMVNA
ncbi:hypothetical protein B0H10DRAFT_1944993 [Mycena sp. CBHHK59/15]|nr:hypothetical protein B0H10DRAFT_1944993 [Mycena sp. CBHHK59/15]